MLPPTTDQRNVLKEREVFKELGNEENDHDEEGPPPKFRSGGTCIPDDIAPKALLDRGAKPVRGGPEYSLTLASSLDADASAFGMIVRQTLP